MENNKNVILLFIAIALALAFFVGGMVYGLWGPS